MTLEERSAERRRRIVAHRAANHAEAEQWDLEFWQSLTPQERLSAAAAIQQDLEAIGRGEGAAKDDPNQESPR